MQLIPIELAKWTAQNQLFGIQIHMLYISYII